jgi:cell division transport system permease protein
MRLSFFFREAIRSIRANAAISVAAVVTVMIAVFILGTFIPSYLYVQSTVNQEKARLDIQVYVADAATTPQVSQLQGAITNLQDHGQIKSYSFISKQQALQKLKNELSDQSILTLLPNNPLPASFDIIPADPAHDAQIAAALRNNAAIDTTMPGQGIDYSATTTDRLLSVAKFIQYTGFVLILILLVAAILLIGNTIRLSIFARRREVEVMRLVGATNWFIRWPFVIEGIICGVAGAIVSVIALYLAKVFIVQPWIDSNSNQLTKDTATTISFSALAVILILAGGLVGAFGSGVTLRRFLKV